MCGIFGVAAIAGLRPSIRVEQAERLRDMLAHRGPDGAGQWAHHNVILGHRRLAVVDPSPAGAQPMSLDPGGVVTNQRPPRSPEPRYTLVYNGELYNDAELRAELRARGVRFASTCDAETVLQAWSEWGSAALARLRGMFALAIYDAHDRTLTLARDPLGVKPLYYHVGAHEVVFASEPGPIVAHPDVGARPDAAMVSVYLSTIRTVLGDRTLFQGVHAVRPGEMMRIDLAGERPVAWATTYWRGPMIDYSRSAAPDASAECVRDSITDSVTRHLRSDVPVCSLLSGGLDSTIVSAIARKHHPSLRTYAAGAPLPCTCRDNVLEGDLAWARVVSQELGTQHAEAHVTREMFVEQWPTLVRKLGVPLSTPNEIAIWLVASRLRADGCIVALSGEGADELFAGYDGPLTAAADYCASFPVGQAFDARAHALQEITSNAWVGPAMKPAIMRPEIWASIGADEFLVEEYQRQFELAAQECNDDPLETHLRVQRRINLTGLLQRLDTATMLASVEGRTPFADVRVAELAEMLPIALKFSNDVEQSEHGGANAGTLTAVQTRTKLVLRDAFADMVPAGVLTRAKASFPLPFREWLPDHAQTLRSSEFVHAVFNEAIVDAVANEPERLWNLAWPMMNLAMWAR